MSGASRLSNFIVFATSRVSFGLIGMGAGAYTVKNSINAKWLPNTPIVIFERTLFLSMPLTMVLKSHPFHANQQLQLHFSQTDRYQTVLLYREKAGVEYWDSAPLHFLVA